MEISIIGRIDHGKKPVPWPLLFGKIMRSRVASWQSNVAIYPLKPIEYIYIEDS